MTDTQTVAPGDVITLPRTYTVSEVIALTGASYRFVDHACRAGYLPKKRTGSGNWWLFTEAEAHILHAVMRLVEAGFSYRAAFDIARQLVERDEPYHVLVGSTYEITVRIVTPPSPEEGTP